MGGGEENSGPLHPTLGPHLCHTQIPSLRLYQGPAKTSEAVLPFTSWHIQLPRPETSYSGQAPVLLACSSQAVLSAQV